MFSNKDKYYLSVAIDNANEHEAGLSKGHNVAAILKVGDNLYHGYNQKKTHPLQKEFGNNEHCIYLHAEIDCIRKAYRGDGYIAGSTLYVARTLKNGIPANACPCEGCQEAIEHFNIGTVYFTTSNNYGILK